MHSAKRLLDLKAFRDVLCCLKQFLCLHFNWSHDGFLHKPKYVAKQQLTRSVKLIELFNRILHNFLLSDHNTKRVFYSFKKNCVPTSN